MSVHTIHVTQIINDGQDTPDEEFTDEVIFTSDCPGGSCSVWWECNECRDEYAPTEKEDDEGEYTRHGAEHRRIEDMWMTDSGDCAITTDGGSDSMQEAAQEAGLGTHQVELDYDGDGCFTARILHKESTK